LFGAVALDALLVLMYALTVQLPQTPAAKPLTFLFDVEGEGNIPAWWSGAQLLLIGLVCFTLAMWFFQSDERIAPLRRLFLVTGLAFAYLSADEIGSIHEHVSEMLQAWHWLNQVETKLLAALGKRVHRFHGGSLWIPLFAVIGVVLIAWLWPQFKLAWKLWRREMFLLALGFGVLVFGAVVLEGVGDFIPPAAKLVKHMSVGFEEGLEMLGASIVLYSVMRILAEAGARLLPGDVPMAASTARDAPKP
jgi:hypothetical protein